MQSSTTISVAINGVLSTFPATSVKSVIINTLAGANFVECALGDYTLPLTLPTTINGGTGADTLVGGAGRAQINGGAGSDVLVCNAAYQTLNGGAGDDFLSDGFVYSIGHDVFTGGGGDDIVDFTRRTDNLTL